jgi:hypothetical protein
MAQQHQQQAAMLGYAPPPPPSLNGGLYTGEPFAAGAPWRNFPATPDGVYLTSVNLASANPPPGATNQFQGSIRPGNNYMELPGVRLYSQQHSILCQNPVAVPSSFASKHDARFAQYYYY